LLLHNTSIRFLSYLCFHLPAAIAAAGFILIARLKELKIISQLSELIIIFIVRNNPYFQ